MAGMLFRRLSSKDNAAGKPTQYAFWGGWTTQIEFSVFDEEGAVGFHRLFRCRTLVVSAYVLACTQRRYALDSCSQGTPTPDDLRLVEKLKDRHAESLVALLTPGPGRRARRRRARAAAARARARRSAHGGPRQYSRNVLSGQSFERVGRKS